MCNEDVKDLIKYLKIRMQNSRFKKDNLGLITFEKNKPLYIPKRNYITNMNNKTCCAYDTITRNDIIKYTKCDKAVDNTFVCPKHENIKINFIHKMVCSTDCSDINGNNLLCDCESHENYILMNCLKDIREQLLNNITLVYYPNKQIITFHLNFHKHFLAKGYVYCDYKLSGLQHLINIIYHPVDYDNWETYISNNYNLFMCSFMLRMEKLFLIQTNIYDVICCDLTGVNKDYLKIINTYNNIGLYTYFINIYLLVATKYFYFKKDKIRQIDLIYNILNHTRRVYNIIDTRQFNNIRLDKIRLIKNEISKKSSFDEQEKLLSIEFFDEFDGKVDFTPNEFIDSYNYFYHKTC
jgi:hypothetical protein